MSEYSGDPRWSDSCEECGAEIGEPCDSTCIREQPDEEEQPDE